MIREDNVEIWITNASLIKVDRKLYDLVFPTFDSFDRPFYSLVNGFTKLTNQPEKLAIDTINKIDHPPQAFFLYTSVPNVVVWRTYIHIFSQRGVQKL